MRKRKRPEEVKITVTRQWGEPPRVVLSRGWMSITLVEGRDYEVGRGGVVDLGKPAAVLFEELVGTQGGSR